jgi:purine nucleoside phosphorylase
MSTVPEVIAARHLGMRVAALSCITNMACGLEAGQVQLGVWASVRRKPHAPYCPFLPPPVFIRPSRQLLNPPPTPNPPPHPQLSHDDVMVQGALAAGKMRKLIVGAVPRIAALAARGAPAAA